MKRALSFVLLAALAVSTSAASAATPTTQKAYDLFFESDHSLVPAVPAARSRAQDTLAPTPGGPLVPFQVFRTNDPIETVLAAEDVKAEEITNGSVSLYLRFLRAKRKLSCVSFQAILQGDATGTEIANTQPMKPALNPGYNAVTLPLLVHNAARTTTLKTERLRLTVLVGVDAGCPASVLKLVFDNEGRPSHMSVSTCSAPADAPDLNHNGIADACESDVVADTEGDGVPDAIDDCPGVFNPDQKDSNHNGIGDACEQSAPQAPDRDGDGIPDANDNCPDVPNPDQADLNHNGVGDACECTLGAPGHCIPGGGKRRTDCLVEFNTPGPVTYTKNLARVRNILRCHDGDPACDHDGKVDGKCTFMVSICVANRDPRFPHCDASDLRSFEVMRPAGLQNAARLERVVSGLGLEIVHGGQVVSPGLALEGKDVCSPISDLTVPAPVTANGRIRERFVVRAQAMNGKLDKDMLTLECLAR